MLIDSFSLAQMRETVAITAGCALLETSGGVAPDQVRDIAATGVDRISIGLQPRHVAAAVEVADDAARKRSVQQERRESAGS